MAYSEKIRARAQELRDQGVFFKEIADKLGQEFPEIEGVDERTIRRWLSEGNGKEAKPTEAPEWPIVTADDLASLYPAGAVPFFYVALLSAKETGNRRLHRFIKAMLEARGTLPLPWLAAVAAAPILAEDLKAPAFNKLVEVITETRPFTGRGERRSYHARMGPILGELYGQVGQWSIGWGYALFPRGPVVKLSSMDELRHYQPSEKMVKAQEDAILNGKTDLFVDREAPPIEDTIPGSVLEFLSRLPDLDRQKGKVLKVKLPLEALLFRLLGDIPKLLKADKGGKP